MPSAEPQAYTAKDLFELMRQGQPDDRVVVKLEGNPNQYQISWAGAAAGVLIIEVRHK
jgi:hypothetical protein